MMSVRRSERSDIGRNLRPRALRLGFLGGMVLVLLLLAACSSAASTATAEPTPMSTPMPAATQAAAPEMSAMASVEVADQELVDGTVTIAKVVSSGAGWMVIHADNNGAPGPVLGETAVQDGENTEVKVQLDLAGATETLHAMLHVDAGQVGTYEFPGADVPVKQGDMIVMTPFRLQLATGEVNVSLADFSFQPKELVVRAGSTVTWTNNDGNVNHTVTSDTGAWDSGRFSGGGTFSFTFDEPGVYPYHCKPHSGRGMTGEIIVIR